MNEDKTIKSNLGVTLKSEVIEQNSDALVVLLPGTGYTLDMPLMIYSEELALEMGFDILEIEYDFHLGKEETLSKDKVRIVIDESYKIFKETLVNNYKRIIFIGKSIGTLIQRKLQEKLEEEKSKINVSNIYLTPIDKTFEIGLKDNSLVIFGTKDSLLNTKNKEKIKMIDTIEFMEIKDSGHSLDIKRDVIKSIDIIKEIIIKEKEYLKNVYI